jgi:CO/xanthine dehydrogenase FAD-binding subunit
LAIGLDVVDGRVGSGRIAIGCAYTAPLAASLPLADPLSRGELARRAEQLAQEVVAGLPAPLADHQAGSGYRRRMIEVLIRRSLSAAA